ncbi:MAG TPA: M48 family metalloprotease [Actinomycetes bacterium]|jgi:heat shock protein HtpX|nr:M48 family metalloprotease [Actinomycetes bacterium]
MAGTYVPSTGLPLSEQIRRNRRAYRQVVAAFTAALGLLGLVLGLLAGQPGLGLGLGLALAVLLVGFAPGLGERIALSRSRAVPADPDRDPRYHNLVQGLSETAGLPVPRLYVVDARAANAFAVGRGPAHSALVVTRGLLATLNRVELEGVLAHELAHVHSGAARLGTVAVVLGGAPGLLRESRRRGGSPLLGAAAVALAPLALLMRLAAPARRELDADETGAYLTRYPPGLIGALGKLGSGPDRPGTQPGLDHLWIVAPEPAGDQWLQRMYRTHPPVEERVAALREL